MGDEGTTAEAEAQLHLDGSVARIPLERAGWRDVFPIHRVSQRCFEDDAWPWLDVVAALTAPSTSCFKAIADDQVIGYVIGERRGAEMGWIAAIAVDSQWRGRGLGGRLMAAVESALSTPCIRLSLRRSNDAAHRLYDRHGYREVERWPGYYRDGEDAIIMEKCQPL